MMKLYLELGKEVLKGRSRVDGLKAKKWANHTYLVAHGASDQVKETNLGVLVEHKDPFFAIRLHDTDVVKVFADKLELYTGGWQTSTTRERINRLLYLSKLGYYVTQVKSIWYIIRPKDSFREVFKEGVTIHEDGGISGTAPASSAEKSIKLLKQIKVYAEKYAATLKAGKIPLPSGGDCWSCYMADKNGKPAFGNDHFSDHLRENYFVPSLLFNAFRDKGCGVLYFQFAREAMEGKPPKEKGFGNVLYKETKRSIRRFLKKGLGLPS